MLCSVCYDNNHASDIYGARWLTKCAQACLKHMTLKHGNVDLRWDFPLGFVPWICYSSKFSRCCCSYWKQMHDKSKTRLVVLLRWKNTVALKGSRVQISPRKIEQINRATCRQVLLHTTIQPIMDLYDIFTHILQDFFTNTGAIVCLSRCQWSNPGGCESNCHHITTIKHNKVSTKILLSCYPPVWYQPNCK